ncbi:MAG: hypothetical protein GWP15_02620 [Nitrospirae bacterium]|nr:hypothetical protein [Nitrospirota bacterium]
MKKNLRHILIGVVIILLGTLSALVIADTVNQEKQILVDGDMETAGVASWTVVNNATLTKEAGAAEEGSQVLRVTYNAQSYPAASQTITIGTTYRATGWARGDGANGVPYFQDSGIANPWAGTNSTSWQYFDVTFTAQGTQARLLDQATVAGYAEFDDILITELTPPIVNNEDEILVDGDMEEDGTDIPFMKKFDLTQAANITADSGVITGALTYTCAGADFDGTNDYVTYTIPSTLFSTSPSISIVAEFTPDFAYDANADYFIYDSTDSNRYIAWKRSNAASNSLGIYLGNIFVVDIPSATYSAYWNANARNVLVVSGTSGDTDVWLNGTQIVTNDNSAWTPTAPTSFYAGATFAGSNKFDGEIHAISIYSGLLDGTDATNLYNSVDTSNWSVTTGCVSKQLGGAENEGSQVVRVTYNSGTDPYIAQDAGAVVGDTYRLTGWFRGDGTANPQMHTGGAVIKTGTNSTSWQYFDELYTAQYGSIFMMCRNGSAVNFCELDDLLLTASTPPMVNDYKELLVDGDMENAGVASWIQSVAGTITKETGAVEDGTQVLRIAYLSTPNPQYYQVPLTVGKTYRVTGWARGDGTASPRILDGTASINWAGTTSSSWQYFDVTGVATTTSLILRTMTTGASYAEFDDVLVTEVEPQL